MRVIDPRGLQRRAGPRDSSAPAAPLVRSRQRDWLPWRVSLIVCAGVSVVFQVFLMGLYHTDVGTFLAWLWLGMPMASWILLVVVWDKAGTTRAYRGRALVLALLATLMIPITFVGQIVNGMS